MSDDRYTEIQPCHAISLLGRNTQRLRGWWRWPTLSMVIDVKDSPPPTPVARPRQSRQRRGEEKYLAVQKLVFRAVGVWPGRGPRRQQFPPSCIVSDPSRRSANDI